MKLAQEKFSKHIDVMPTLIQVQTYIKNRRQLDGDTDDLVQIQKYVKTLEYYDNIGLDTLFEFGSNICQGTEENRLHYINRKRTQKNLDDSVDNNDQQPVVEQLQPILQPEVQEQQPLIEIQQPLVQLKPTQIASQPKRPPGRPRKAEKALNIENIEPSPIIRRSNRTKINKSNI
jgi:hypothetical protein